MTSYASPKAELVIDPTLKEYTDAFLLAERRGGSLKGLPVVVLFAAALLMLGLSSMSWFRAQYSSMMIPLLLCLFCPLLLIFFFIIQPNYLRSQAKQDYQYVHALMETATLRLYPDDLVSQSSYLTMTDPYALMGSCIETPQLFVLIKDHERLLVIPKRCLPPESEKDITEFLRLVFARRRYVMRNWVF